MQKLLEKRKKLNENEAWNGPRKKTSVNFYPSMFTIKVFCQN